jgi:hypothetical protein
MPNRVNEASHRLSLANWSCVNVTLDGDGVIDVNGAHAMVYYNFASRRINYITNLNSWHSP